jgi:DNA-binding MarR family transcriptional regulator
MAHLIRDAGRLLAKSLQARLSDQSVSFGHWSFLRILWVTEGLTQRELSDQAGVMEPTTFTALKSMEKEGLIERRQLNGNRRKVHIFLTPKGRELKNVLTPMAEKVNAIALSKMSDEEINVTRSVLLRMIENLAGDELLKNH